MRALLAVFALLLGFAAARAEDAAPAGEGEAQAIVAQQWDAFSHDDAKSAFALAAPGIKDKFADADAFMAMVKSAYAPVYRHRSAAFGKQTREGDEVRQGVSFVDADNVVWGGVYTLARQADGAWKITGCVLVRSTETSL